MNNALSLSIWPLALSPSEWINALLLFVTALGVIAATCQLRASAKTSRAIFLKDLYMKLRGDESVCKAFYMVEYGKFSYNQSFHGSEVEIDIDRMLTLFDLVCELYYQSVLSGREMKFFEYQLLRVHSNSDIIKYLNFLTLFYSRCGILKKPFESFQRYGIEKCSK